EDEVWNIIRLDHQSLPTGELKMIPGLFYTRLHHADLEVMDVVARKTESDSIHIYTLTFPASARELSITYEKQFPHRILGWEETWKERGETMSSNARLDKTLFTDYWTKNKNEYLHLRDSLNLPNPY